ncbi:MAG: CRISPR-associated protein Cas4 [Verrucomicrobiota bacterium]
MFAEDQLLPLSALQHLLFCERQCALIHVEQLWAENRLTTEGNLLHEKAHGGPDESRLTEGVRITRGLPIRSLTLGLSGQADVVEFYDDGTVAPVEYKRGKPKRKGDDSDRVQLCAQALCLEEMLDHLGDGAISRGHLFYGQRKRRHDVDFDAQLRATTSAAAERLHELIASRKTPPAIREPKCESCSMLEICMPDALRFRQGAAAWLDRAFDSSLHAPCSPPDP